MRRKKQRRRRTLAIRKNIVVIFGYCISRFACLFGNSWKTRKEIILSEHIICYFHQVIHFIVINTDKDNPIVRQQISCQHQPGINHAAPVGMKPSIGVGILEQTVFVLVVHSHLLVFFFLRAHEIIGIDKIVAGVVRRVDIDHFDLAEIAFLQELEDFQIIALDVEVFGGVPVLALCHTGAQRLPDRLVCFHDSRLLTDPCELVCLISVHHIRRKHLFQQLKIDRPLVHLLLRLAVFLIQHLRDAVGKQGGNAVYILRRQVRRFHA